MPVQNVKRIVGWESKKRGDDKLDVAVLASSNLHYILHKVGGLDEFESAKQRAGII